MESRFENAVTAVATVVSVVIANRLSSRQSGQAKLWDFRRQAYGVILSELASVERMCEVDEERTREDAYEWFHSDGREAWPVGLAGKSSIRRGVRFAPSAGPLLSPWRLSRSHYVTKPPPVVCCLSAGEYQGRIAWIESLTLRALQSHARDDLVLCLS